MPRYSKRKRKQIAQAFISAKKELWDGSKYNAADKVEYICYALPAFSEGHDARELITKRLYPHGSVVGYLRDGLGVPIRQLSDRNVQKFRHQWLDHLIKEFSKE